MVLDYDEHEQRAGHTQHSVGHALQGAEPARSGTAIISGMAEGPTPDPQLPQGPALGSCHCSLNCRHSPNASSELPKPPLLPTLSPAVIDS